MNFNVPTFSGRTLSVFLLAIFCAAVYMGMSSPALSNEKTDSLDQLEGAGITALQSGDYDTALQHWEKGLLLARQEHQRSREVIFLANLGNAYKALGKFEKALELFKQAVKIDQDLGNWKALVEDLTDIANLHIDIDRYQDALEYYLKILEIHKNLSDRNAESNDHTIIGELYQKLGKNQEAVPHLTKSVEIYHALQKPESEASALFRLGKANRELGDYKKAKESYEGALALAHGLNDRELEGKALANLGIFYSSLSDYKEALSYLEQALVIHRELNDKASEVKALNTVGIVYKNMGLYERAFNNYTIALTIAQKSDLGKIVLPLIQNLKVLVEEMRQQGSQALKDSNYAEALEHYRLGLAIADYLNDFGEKSFFFTNLGSVYQELNQCEAALQYHYQALKIDRDIFNDFEHVALDLSNLASGFACQQNYEKAFELYNQALEIRRQLKDQQGQAKTLFNIGVLHEWMENFSEALMYFEESLQLRMKVGDHAGGIRTLISIGHAYNKLERPKTGATYIELALTDYFKGLFHIPDLYWQLFLVYSESYSQQSLPDLAIFYGKQAVNSLQALRGEILNLEQPLQKTFLTDRGNAYEFLANLLINEGRLWEAQQVLAMLKEEEYFDFIRRQGDDSGLYTQLALTPQEREYVSRYQNLQPRIVTLGTRHGELLQLQQQRDLRPEEQTELHQVEVDLNDVRQAFEVFLRDLEVAFQQTPRNQEREFPEAELKNLEGFQSTLAALGSGTVALHYLSTKDRLRVIVTSGIASQVPFHRDSLIGEASLNRQILTFRKILQNPHGDPLPQAQVLYKLLFGGIAEDLKKLEAKTLLVYLDGALRYLPLAALHDGTRYVAEQYGVVLYTPAAKDKLKDRPTAEWRVAGLGVSQGSGSFSALPAVPEELDGIVKEARDDDLRGVLPGIAYLDQAFTKAQLSGALREGYPVVHLASHFHFGGGTDVDSYFLVGGGGKLTLSEFKGVAYPLGQVDLLTLSACETGVGGASQDGREVEGLGALAQRRGAKAVLATLWSVADRSTGQFMQDFYQLRQDEHLTKAEALRRAQERFILGEQPISPEGTDPIRAPGSATEAEGAETFVPTPGAPYAHPYYWAPFILMGNFL